MKKNLFLMIACTAVALFSSCKKSGFLDATILSELDSSTVFSDSARSSNFLGNVYTQIGFSYNPAQFGNAGLEAACDEAKGYATGASDAFLQFQNGIVNSANTTPDPWNICYKNIRALNIYLSSIGKTPMNDFTKQHYIGEAHFLRAWFYSILLKYYGGVPLVGDTVYKAEDNINPERSSYEDCVNYIVNECNVAKDIIGKLNDPRYYGRATAGACIALQSRVLLYAASPLFNGGNIGEGDDKTKALTGYLTYDINRWKLAADAALSLINGDAGVQYSLFTGDNGSTDSLSRLPGHSFKFLFVVGAGNAAANKEGIFMQLNSGNNRTMELLWNPPTRGGGRHAWPYQETANAFGMINGKSITDPASGYNSDSPYINRDPRFGYSILYNGQPIWKTISLFVHAYQPLLTYAGAITGDGFNAGTPTGYYIAKLTDDRSDANNNFGTNHDYMLIRYAEILLNFCEAENEYAPGDPAIFSYLKSIRQRAGIEPGSDGNYGLKAGMNQAELRQAIRDERRVELAFESHRFWDVRRWKIADQTENQVLHGVKITRQPDGSFTYEQPEIDKRSFSTPMYFWPIPQSETQKSPLIKQNPGYDR